ncbi:MAG: multidrug ABC transporter ATP-binding protein [Chloroflexi bacterium RBG_16_56_11]|nr:MAG: multidrug ABC transporter ATP-binding protein [Chloroflexi bacterium RBG_16_56_11]
MPPIITVQNLRKTYGPTVAVDDISFEVAEGEIFGLLGPNGAGKTTTVECLQALRQPDSGEIRVLGLDPRRQARELRKLIGSQLQESALPDRIRVWEALDLFASVTPRALDWRMLLEQWGLAAKRRSSFSSLSGGQRQRLFIALALVNNPKVVFLDEMTTGLDPAARRVAWDLIRAIRDNGTTVVLVTHFMDEAEKLCDRVAVVDKGKIIAADAPQGLIVQHAGEVRVIFTTDVADIAWLEAVPRVDRVERKGLMVEVRGSGPVIAYVAAALVGHGIIPGDLRVEQPTLEDVFLKLTGHSAGD